MPTTLASVLLAAITHGAVVVPLLWVIGVILLLAGVVSLFRGALLAGLLLIIVGVLLGGLNVF
jgi:hypothetical protein